MQKIQVYQFIKLRDEGFSENLQKVIRLGALPVIDLEDSVQDPDGFWNTAFIKTSFRDKFVKAVRSFDRNTGISFGLRLNTFGSIDFYRDVEALSALNITYPVIFLPKAETASSLKSSVEYLGRSGISFTSLIPIIETVKGYENLEQIAGVLKTCRGSQIAFGHCDFNYDSGFFPFHHQDSPVFWTWIERIAEVAKKYDVCYINSPYLHLGDYTFFQNLLSAVFNICKGEFGQVTLTSDQTKLCFEWQNQPDLDYTKLLKPESQDDRKKLAEEVIRDFRASFSLDKGFSARNANRLLISPHEYQAAKDYLTLSE
jgi:citrate lyase beta subunit